MAVRFAERGRDVTQVIATVRRAAGTALFTPAPGLNRRRSIEADVADPSGTPGEVATVAHFRAPAPLRGGRVGRIRFVRHGLNALLSWGRATRAVRYDVTIAGSDGRITQLQLPARRRSVVVGQTLPYQRFTAKIVAEGGPDRLTGPARTARLAATARRQPRPTRPGTPRTAVWAALRLTHVLFRCAC